MFSSGAGVVSFAGAGAGGVTVAAGGCGAGGSVFAAGGAVGGFGVGAAGVGAAGWQPSRKTTDRIINARTVLFMELTPSKLKGAWYKNVAEKKPTVMLEVRMRSCGGVLLVPPDDYVTGMNEGGIYKSYGFVITNK